MAAEAVREGADVVTMSGDKLLGGPQAGIILGRLDSIAKLRTNPLTRALRVDKLTLAALEATLALYREPDRARREIPVLAMLTATKERLTERAATLAESLGGGARAVASEGSVGGGAFPTARLAGAAVELPGDAVALDALLRAAPVPVVGRIIDGRLRLDLRSVPELDEPALLGAARGVLS